jgi:hypothetical protein
MQIIILLDSDCRLLDLLHNNRPPVNERKFISTAIENVINQVNDLNAKVITQPN